MTYTLLVRAEGGVWVALSDQGGAYAEAADAIRNELHRSGVGGRLVIRPWRELPVGTSPAIVVSVGVGALRGIAESDIKAPVLATLVPRAAYLRLADGAGRASPRPMSAVWLDQPFSRQFGLLRLALPARHRVGTLLGSESRLFEQELQRASAERNLELATVRVDAGDQLPTAVQGVLEDTDVLLALPDPQVFNGATIQNILTAAYRRRVPLVGFSPAYVKAGAMLALYSTPTQMGVQVADVVRAVLAGRPMPPPQGPRTFTIGINADVARSLGITIEEDAAARWTERLAREKGS